MSAKLLHALTDDNPDLQKQMGCMNGIFQLFDHQYFLTGRRIYGPSHKRLTAGHSHHNSSNLVVEPDNEHHLQTDTERNWSKNMNENQRVSMKSFRTSFSSSFSSLDCNNTSQPEPPSFDRTIFPETPSRDLPMSQFNASPQLGRQSHDFQDVVKESINREASALSVKTTTKEPVSHVVKHRDSPRPLPLSKSVDGSQGVGINGKPRVSVDLNESLRVLAKLREAPKYYNESRERPRSSYEAKDGSLFPVSKDAPRFSFDGREIPCPSFESRDSFKSTIKIRELPRLSLDSREGSIRSCNNDSRLNSILKDLQMGSGNSNNRVANSPQELGTHKRPPSVVAKLMGLEALPNSTSATEGQTGFNKTCQGENRDSFSRSSKMTDESKQNLVSGSPRSSHKDPISPRLRHLDPVMKPISSSRFPIEPAPWRQPDGGCGFQKPAFRNWDAPGKPPNSPSVYSEIEKRLKDLEFKQSDKDLRALKQILEAMQSKGLLETRKEDQATNFVSQRNYSPNHTSLNQDSRFTNRRNPQNNRSISAPVKGTTPQRTFESPIVIMKPAKLIEKSVISASSVIPIDGLSSLRKPQSGDSVDSRKVLVSKQTAKELTPKQTLRDTANRTLNSMEKKNNGRTLRSQTSSRPQQFPRENTESSGRSSGSVSPRLQQKRLELEKRSPRPPIPSSDAIKQRRHAFKQPTESGSPGGKLGPKSPNLQKSDDQLSEISSETRNLSKRGDGISLQSDSNISLASQMDVEVTSTDQSAEVNCSFFQQGSQSPSRNVNISDSSLKHKKLSGRLNEDGLMAELTTVAPEQPSPISVLDGSFYRDDSPSPVKNISNAFKDDESRNADDNSGEDEWNLVDVDHLSDSIGPNVSFEINRKKLESIDNLVQKLRRLNSNHNEATTDYIASLCENTNPDHRYISEILLASGLLLRDLSSGLASIQLHPSGHPINPDLFFVLEKTKASTGLVTNEHNCEKAVQSKPDQKLHRRFMFDAVNEILVQKLALVGPSPEPWLRADKLVVRTLNAQRLLRELCSEIDQVMASNSVCSLEEDDDGSKSILWENMMRQSENWTDFSKEVPGVVLDVERLIFKDLIDEILSGVAAKMRT